jgi:hypothetical protein
MENTYKLKIGFGDGKPIEIEVEAKSGYLAYEKVGKDYPSAKSIHLLGVVATSKPHPLFN